MNIRSSVQTKLMTKSTTPLLSIVIVSFNTKALTVACIKSVLTNPTRKHSFEVIVVDNGSTDDSMEVLNTLAKRVSGVRIIDNGVNLGFSKANNIGIRAGKGRYFLLLNSDTVVTPGSLDRLMDFALSSTDIGVIGAQLLNPDTSTQPSVFRFPTLWRTLQHYWLGRVGLLDKYYPNSTQAVEVEAVVGAALLITPEAITNAGLLDERYFMYFEDIDYCRQVQKVGLKVYYLPSAKVIHYHGASGKHLSAPIDQWKRLIPSSIIYHGYFKHNLITFIIWTSQKLKRVLIK